jgi:hypothetical protein
MLAWLKARLSRWLCMSDSRTERPYTPPATFCGHFEPEKNDGDERR